jgi:hypothetical protein
MKKWILIAIAAAVVVWYFARNKSPKTEADEANQLNAEGNSNGLLANLSTLLGLPSVATLGEKPGTTFETNPSLVGSGLWDYESLLQQAGGGIIVDNWSGRVG